MGDPGAMADCVDFEALLNSSTGGPGGLPRPFGRFTTQRGREWSALHYSPFYSYSCVLLLGSLVLKYVTINLAMHLSRS